MNFRSIIQIFVSIEVALLIGCNTTRKQTFTPNKFSDPIEIKDTFEMTILCYAPGCNCGTRACASLTIGCTKNKDTFRVLSLCNTDTSFHINQRILIFPMKVPDFKVSVPLFYPDNWNHEFLSDFRTRNYKTIYGKLVKE